MEPAMADDQDHTATDRSEDHENHEREESEELATQTTENSDHDDDDHDDDADGGFGEQAVGGVPGATFSRRHRNQRVVGELVVHYPQRDVPVVLDGEAAMRLMAIFGGADKAALADVLDPLRSPAENGWFLLDTAEPLAMTWLPGLPGPRQRTAIDPEPAAI